MEEKGKVEFAHFKQQMQWTNLIRTENKPNQTLIISLLDR